MKKYFYILFIFILIILPINAYAVELIDTYSPVVLIYDITDDNILFNKSGSEKKSIASLTKIMTTITAIEMIDSNENLSYKSEVKITPNMFYGIASDASLAGLRSGQVVTYEDLFYAIILPSGADATHVVAYGLSGGIAPYVEQMNALAKKIGVSNTNFVNTHGLDENNHYSNAEDVLKILNYAMKNEMFKKVYTAKEYTLSTGLTVYSTIHKYNSKLGIDTSKIIGSKTGFTGDAGTCITTYFNSNNHEFLTVTLGAKYVYNDAFHLRDAVNIINFIDNNFKDQLLIGKNTKVDSIKVHWSDIKNVDVVTKSDVTKYLANDFDKNLFKYKYEGVKEIYPKDDLSVPVGVIKYYYDNKEIFSEDVYVDKAIEFKFIEYVKENKNYFIIGGGCFGGFLLLVILLVIIKKKRKK